MQPFRSRKKVLTVGGSDPSGSTGIQADLKAFSSVGVHGATVITCITAQSPAGLVSSHPLPLEQVGAQLECILADLSPAFTKLGLLPTAEIARFVAKRVASVDTDIVVDPVMATPAGESLIAPDVVEVYRRNLIPGATITTPNLAEASAILGWEVKTLNDSKKAAEEIREMGAKAVLVTGGHLPGNVAIDVLNTGKARLFRVRKLPKQIHGTGAALSALIAAFLAKGKDVEDAVQLAKQQVTEYIRHGYDIGEGLSVIDVHAGLFNAAERYRILQEVRKAAHQLERTLPPRLLPEVGSNIAYAVPNASSLEDVCSIDGRLLRTGKRVQSVGSVDFGADVAVAHVVLRAMERDHRIRCAMNIRYTQRIVSTARRANLWVGTFDPDDAPEEEAGSVAAWGAAEAIRQLGAVPDLVFDEGGQGYEAQVHLFGNNPKEVLAKLSGLLEDTET